MDTTVYEKLYDVTKNGFADFNVKSAYKVKLSHVATKDTEYPLVVMEEITNLPRGKYYGSRERVSTLGYKFEITAKAFKGRLNVTVCREIMQFITDFMQNKIGLSLISNNLFPREGTNGELCRIVLVFQRPFYENKETFI